MSNFKPLQRMKNLLFTLLLFLGGMAANAQNTPPAASDQTDEAWFATEQMPVFPGEEAALYKFLFDNLKYPESAMKNNIQGTVWVRFVVTEKGKVSQPEVVRGIDPECDKEALRVVSSLPDFTPGQKGGKAVPVYYMVRVVFKLNQGKQA